MVTAETVLRILIRSATQFLKLAWKELGEPKQIVSQEEYDRLQSNKKP